VNGRCDPASRGSMLLFVDPPVESINDLRSAASDYGFPASTRSVESLAITFQPPGRCWINDRVVRWCGEVCSDRPAAGGLTRVATGLPAASPS